MTGQYDRMSAMQADTALIALDDIRLRPALEPLFTEAFSASTSLSWQALQDLNASVLSSIDIVFLVTGKEFEFTSDFLGQLESDIAGRVIVIDFKDSMKRSTEMMRHGALDYLAMSMLDIQTLRESLARLATLKATKESMEVDDEPSDMSQINAPFSGAWLTLPEEVMDNTWPFTMLEIAEGKARLGAYDVLEYLGMGGAASVFKVRHRQSEQLYALKLMDNQLIDDVSTRRFAQEFELLNEIHHPNVVRILEHVAEGEYFYNVMEYLPGGDLKSRIREGVSRTEAIQYAAQIAAGLQAAYELNILHRDLKPANILFREDGALALVDFGVAKAFDSHDKHLTKEGQIIGTPYYISPEQAVGGKIDQRCDLYALGVILYEMLEGKRPFTGKTSLQVFTAHVREPIPALTDKWDGLNGLIEVLLAKSPEDRPDNGAQVIGHLKDISPEDVPEGLV